MAEHDQLQQAILGSMITWPESIDKVSTLLTAEDFTAEKYQTVFRYLVENDGGDLITLSAALRGKVAADELVTWTSHDITSAFLPRYCQDLKEVSRKIRVFEAAGHVRLMFETATSSEMIDKLEAATASLSVQAKREPRGAKDLVIDAARRLKSRYANRGKIQGIPYGFSEVDQATQGMHRGELIIVAGRPSMGKSALASNILENVCEAGYAGMLFSLEMDAGNVTDRMIASRGGIQYQNIRSGNLTDPEWAKHERCSTAIMNYRLTIDDTPGITLREIRTKARQRKRNGLDVLAIDYLQLMGINARDNRVQAIGEISRGLKQLARELDVAVVALSQLNRGVDSRPDKRPIMSDLRDSGEIEQDADVILFPYRPAAYCAKCKDRVNDDDNHNFYEHQALAELIIEKQRNGERNLSIPLAWMGKYQRFTGVNTVNLD